MGGFDVGGVGSFADFPTLFDFGVYGGLGCSALSACAIALYAVLRRQGTQRQVAGSLLVCLGASCLLFAPIWWATERLGVLGPTLDVREVALALACVGMLGWFTPLATLVSYIALAAPAPANAAGRRYAPQDAAALQAALTDPARQREPLGAGLAWGWLTPLDDFAGAPAIPLVNELILVGREGDNDIVLEDTGVSRHHAELLWDHGHPQLKDRGSANGTLLNRQAARGRLPLKTGDTIQFGGRRYRFEALEPEAAARLANEARQAVLADIETRKVKRTASGARPHPNGAAVGETNDGSDSAELSAPLPVAPTLELVAVSGPTPGARWALQAPMMTIGRDQECAITLPDASVSRLHAQIVRQPAGFFVADLHSSNGAYLNGKRLTAPGLIQPGDTLRIGEIELRCEAPVPATPPDGVVANGANGPHASNGRHKLNGAYGQASAEEGEPTTPTEAVPTQPTVAMGAQPKPPQKER